MIKTVKGVVTLSLLLVCVTENVFSQTSVKSYTSGSYQQIIKQYQGNAFVMALWSLDCPSCYKELAMLAEERKQRNFNLVLISVDGEEGRGEVEAVISKYKLTNVDNWLFEEHSSQSLRYEIDPLWYGEVPRSYLFDKTHQRQGVSGVLKKEQLSH